MRLRTLAAATTIAVLALAACGGGDGTPVIADAPDTAPGPSDVVFSVTSSGGFVSPDVVFGSGPRVAVLGDGTTLQPGPMIEIYPGPAYVPLQRGHLPGSEIDRLGGLAVELGLTGEPVDAGQLPVADVPDTVVVIRTAAGDVVTHRANALGMDVGVSEGRAGSMTEAQRDARARLQQFVTDLETATSALATEEYVPDGYALRATVADPSGPAADPATQEPRPRVRAWPVASVDLAAAAECLAVRGHAAGEVRTAMKAADQLTFFTAGGASYRVVVRSLLPREVGCPAA